jgi:hypothetical protein
LLAGLDFDRLIADRGYWAEHFIAYWLERGIEVVIPPHQRAKILREYDTSTIPGCTVNVIWWNVLSTKSSIFVGSSRGLTSWIAHFLASYTLSVL